METQQADEIVDIHMILSESREWDFREEGDLWFWLQREHYGFRAKKCEWHFEGKWYIGRIFELALRDTTAEPIRLWLWREDYDEYCDELYANMKTQSEKRTRIIY